MSGAEVLAIVGGVAAFTGLLKNAKDTVSWIRSGPSGDQLSVKICEVELRFELLSELLAALQKLGFKTEDLESKVLKDMIEKISRRLRDLQDIVKFGESLKDARKRDRAKHAIKEPARTKELQQCIRSLDSDMDLIYKILHIRAFARTLPGLNPTPMTHLAIDAQQSEQVADSGQDTETPGSELMISRSYLTFSQRSRCSRGTCPCSCHYAIGIGYRRHWFESPSWSSIFTRCNCSSKSFSWIFNAFQRQISLAVSIAYGQSFSFSPSLRVVNTVPNTSPLFVVLYKYRKGVISLENALMNIQKTVSTGTGSLYDVNRNGRNWFEKLIELSYEPSERRAILDLLAHLTSGKVSVDSEELFLQVLPWIKYASDTEFLEILLPRNGQTPLIDPTRVHANFFLSWYERNHWEIGFPSLKPELSFIRSLQPFLNHCIDFGDTGPLQYQILTSSLDSVARYLDIKGSACLIGERNFFGQSALHISIDKPKILEILLSHGFDTIVDAGDRNHVTSLMYAAACGESDSAIQLLRAGADPKFTDVSGRTFSYYAVVSKNFQLITDVYHFLSAEWDIRNAQTLIDKALHYYFWSPHEATDADIAGLQTLLELGARPSRVTDKGNTLFHTVTTVEEASILLKYCSPPQENSQNVAGYTPLMVLSRIRDVDLTRNLISSGSSIHQRDHHGWSVLEHVFQATTSRYWSDGFGPDPCVRFHWAATFEIASDLLQAGVDFGTCNSCQCPCSLRGHDVSRFSLPGLHYHKYRLQNIHWIPWVVELFLLLRQVQKKELHAFVRSLIRRQRFDEIGMSHTCCINRNSIYFNAWLLEDGRTVRTDYPDLAELREEQQQLTDELEQYCENDPEDWEYALIKTLARRVIFIERGSEQFSSGISRQIIEEETREQEHQSYYDSNQFEFVGDRSQRLGINYGNDTFGYFNDRFRLGDYKIIHCIEDSIQTYLHEAKSLDYGNPQTPTVQGANSLHDERQQLCTLLTQEIQVVRKLSNKEADWTLDIVGSGEW